jgi:hypothetical protein
VIAAGAKLVAVAVRGNSSGHFKVNAYALPSATSQFAANSSHFFEEHIEKQV